MKTIFKWIFIILGLLGFLILALFSVVWIGYFPPMRQFAGGYELDESEKFIQGPNGRIPPRIIDSHDDDTYITVRQLPEAYPTVGDVHVYPAGRDHIHYWLIEVADSTIVGPLTREQFDSLLVEKNIPEKLHFTSPM